jgi:hypothetical protein
MGDISDSASIGSTIMVRRAPTAASQSSTKPRQPSKAKNPAKGVLLQQMEMLTDRLENRQKEFCDVQSHITEQVEALMAESKRLLVAHAQEIEEVRSLRRELKALT